MVLEAPPDAQQPLEDLASLRRVLHPRHVRPEHDALELGEALLLDPAEVHGVLDVVALLAREEKARVLDGDELGRVGGRVGADGWTGQAEAQAEPGGEARRAVDDDEGARLVRRRGGGKVRRRRDERRERVDILWVQSWSVSASIRSAPRARQPLREAGERESRRT